MPLAAFTGLATFSLVMGAAFNALAETATNDTHYEGMAHPYQLNLQPPVTPVMEHLYNLHSALLILITVISIFVLCVMTYICLRFRRSKNPVPSKTTHNTLLEIIWTTIPIVILVTIAIPSLRLHYYMQQPVDAEMTVKVVGYQWYWHYDYPDHGGFGFDSYIKKGEDLKPGDHRQLSVDNKLVVPVDTKIKVQMTGADVIHSWAVPAFGVKKDAVPGRLNESWFQVTKIGTYYGQCSQLCGVGHGFMPIVVEVVSKEDFAVWVKQHAPAKSDAAAQVKEKSAPGKDKEKPAVTDSHLAPSAGSVTKPVVIDEDADKSSDKE